MVRVARARGAVAGARGVRWLARAADAPGWALAKMRTAAYRRAMALHPTARVLEPGVILNPAGRREAVRMGEGTVMRGEIFVFPHAGAVALGDWCFVGPHARLWSSAQLRVGNRVLISHQVNIHDTNGHPTGAARRAEHFRLIATSGHPRLWDDMDARPVAIADDAWIGFGATVLKGVTVGRGAIVAAQAVVTADVAPFTVVAGNPARVVKDLPHE